MVTLADARRVIAAAEKKAAAIGQPMNIAVVDSGANLVAHVRMDRAVHDVSVHAHDVGKRRASGD